MKWERNRVASGTSPVWTFQKSVLLALGVASGVALGTTQWAPKSHAQSVPVSAQLSATSLQDLLFRAIRGGNMEAVRSIVDAGAEITHRNKDGKTATDIAIESGQFEIAQYLVLARRLQQREEAKRRLPVEQNAPGSLQEHAPPAPAVTATIHQRQPEAAPVVTVEDPRRFAAPQAEPAPIRRATLPRRAITPAGPEAKAPSAAGESAAMTAEDKSAEKLDQVADKLNKAAEALAAALSAAKTGAAPTGPSVEDVPQVPQMGFVPTPGRKPDTGETSPAIAEAPVPRTTSSRDLQQLSPAPVTPVVQPASPRTVRPARPISPRLLRKLRRTPKATRRPRVVSEAQPDNLLKPVETAAVEPSAEASQAEAPAVPESEDSLIGQVFSGIGNFFGLGGSENAKDDSQNDTGARPTVTASPKSEPDSASRQPTHPPARLPARFVRKSVPVTPVTREPDSQGTSSPQANAAPLHSAPNNPFEQRFEQRREQVDVSRVQTAAPSPATAPIELAEVKELTLTRQGRTSNAPLPVQATRRPAPRVEPRVEPRIGPRVEEPKVAAVPAPAPRQGPVTELGRIASGTPAALRAAREAASLTPETTKRRTSTSMPLNKLRTPLTNVLLTMGDSVTTGQPQLPRGIAEPNACVHKSLGKAAFCIVPVDWPRQIEDAFRVNTSFYQGSRAIARYDKGIATHYHAMFNTADYDRVVAFLKQRFGPPTDVWRRVIAPFDQPRQPNPTFVWRSKNSQSDQVTILEVRKFDDTRNVFPDINNGALRLYIAGGPKVFPVVTALDIMNIDWAARSDHIDDGTPISASTLRVAP